MYGDMEGLMIKKAQGEETFYIPSPEELLDSNADELPAMIVPRGVSGKMVAGTGLVLFGVDRMKR